MRGILILALLLLGACQNLTPRAVDQPSGVIRDLHTGQRLSAQALVERLAGAPRLIVGEQHDNPDHHDVQLWLLQALARQRAQGSLLLEMLTSDQQVRVDEVHALSAARWPADLPAALAWQSGWDWNLYGPIVRYALVQPYPLLAANLDSIEVRRIYKQAPAVSGARSNAAAVKLELLAQIRDGHCGLLPERRMPAMLAVQQQRDRQMAMRLLAAPAPAVLFAGGYHARLDIGVPVHVQDISEHPAPVVVMLAEKGAVVSLASADYVWYTASRPVQDYCAQLRH
ncbi:ChaN family lipoprotein [Pseudomonas sp. 6D_7.1_Bac1]|uniref:ChaN family lipoprotein n=1 Tax=Pseudomonas sp. 6D_7.1_Bac1 TaxID=2971615 RepID=UPI0021C8C468|nr:ChaN family lipoprotein [Pseudomonas sp. 6D_7.1_Bac1]MCU1750983.1 ChaN family lipoprotein [Pseudomonas sp. 6D_7.1_Bac1]